MTKVIPLYCQGCSTFCGSRFGTKLKKNKIHQGEVKKNLSMLPEKQFICTKMFNLNKLGLLGDAIYQILTHLCLMVFPNLSFGQIHFCFKGYWVVFLIFIQILIEHSVSKRWRP